MVCICAHHRLCFVQGSCGCLGIWVFLEYGSEEVGIVRATGFYNEFRVGGGLYCQPKSAVAVCAVLCSMLLCSLETSITFQASEEVEINGAALTPSSMPFAASAILCYRELKYPPNVEPIQVNKKTGGLHRQGL